MRAITSVNLACRWADVPRYLSRRWVRAITPYVDRELSQIMGATVNFPGDDPLLPQFLAVAETKTVSDPQDRSFLSQIGLKRDGGPLLRWVRRWNEYDLADFDDYPIAQLLPTREIELVDPIEQYYQMELERTPGCSSCGRAILIQQRPLKIRVDYESDHYPRADTWRPGDHIFLTENDEFIISQYLRELWEAVLPDSPPFARVETNAPAMPLFWQVTRQGTAHVLAPPTLLQARERCPACGRPRVVALSTSPIANRYGPGRQTLYEGEARLTIDPTAITAGDFWTADRQHGQILESWAHMQGMTPVYRRTARSFRLVSRRLLRLLYEHVPGGWRAIPVEAPSRSTPFYDRNEQIVSHQESPVPEGWL